MIIVLVLEPYAGRYGEAQLRLFRYLLGQVSCRRLTHRVLGVELVHSQRSRQRSRYLEYLFIEEGHAQLERVRHAHSVGFEKDISDHPHIDIEILHLRLVVIAARAGVHSSAHTRGIGCDLGVLQQFLLLLFVIHIGVADIALLQRVDRADQIIPTLDIGQLFADPADSASEEVRHDLLIPFKDARIVVAGVAAEQLVRALARQHDLDVLARDLRDKVQRDTRRVSQGLIHVILHLRHSRPEFLGRDQLRVMLHADLLRQRLCPVDLVIFLAEIKSDGKGFLALKVRGNVRRIHSRREETAYLNVRDLMRFHAVLKDLLDLVHRFFLGHFEVGLEFCLKVALCLHHAVTVPHKVTGQQAVYVLEEGHRLRHILERQIRVQRLVVEPLHKVGVLQNALDLRGIAQLVADQGIVQGLDTEEVAREEHRSGVLVIDCEGEHTAQMLKHILAPLLKRVDDDLAVRCGREVMILLLQLFFQFLVVIYFAVIGEHQIARLVGDRLIALFEVDDGQSAETHRDIIIHEKAVRIRPAMGDDFRHFFDDVFSLFQLSCKAANTAHIAKLLSKVCFSASYPDSV